MITLADLAVELNVADPLAVLVLAHHLRDTDRIEPAGITESYRAGLDVAWATQVELSDLAADAVREHIHQMLPVLALQQVRVATESWQRLDRARWDAILEARATFGVTVAQIAGAAGASRDKLYRLLASKR